MSAPPYWAPTIPPPYAPPAITGPYLQERYPALEHAKQRYTDLTAYHLPYQGPYLGAQYQGAYDLLQRGPYTGRTWAETLPAQGQTFWDAWAQGRNVQPYEQASADFLTRQLTGQTPVGDFSGTAQQAIPMAFDAMAGRYVYSTPYTYLGQAGGQTTQRTAQGQQLGDPYRALTGPSQGALGQILSGQFATQNPYAYLGQVGGRAVQQAAGGQMLAGDPYARQIPGMAGSLQALASGQMATQNPYEWMRQPAFTEQIATARGGMLNTPYDPYVADQLRREQGLVSGGMLGGGQYGGLSGIGQQGATVGGGYLGGGGYAGATGAQRGLEQRTLGGELLRDPWSYGPYQDWARQQQTGTIAGQRPTQNPFTGEFQRALGAESAITQTPTTQDPFFRSAAPGIQQLSATAGGAATNPYLDALYGAQSRAVEEAYNRTVLPGVETRFAQAGRFGSGQYESARGQAEETLGRTLSDLAGDVYGRGFEAERGRQLDAAGQLAQMGLQGYGAERGLEAQLAQAGQGLYGDIYGLERGAQERAAQAREQLGATAFGRERGYQQEMGLAGLERGADLYSRERALQEQAAAGRQQLGFESYRQERGAQDAAREAALARASGLYGQERGLQEGAAQFAGGTTADMYRQARDLQAQTAQFGYGAAADAYARERAAQDAAAQFGLGGAMDLYSQARQAQLQAGQFGYGTAADVYGRERGLQEAAAQYGLGTATDLYSRERALADAAREGMLDRGLQAQLAEQQYGLQALGYAPQIAGMGRDELGFAMDALAQEQAQRQAMLDDQYRRYMEPWGLMGQYQGLIGLPWEYASTQYGVNPARPDTSTDSGGGLF